MSDSAKDSKDYHNTEDIIINDGEDSVRDKKPGRGSRRLEHWQVIAAMLMVYDFVAVNFSYFLALWLRFDCKFSTISNNYINAWRSFIPIYSVFSLIAFYFIGLYRSIWRFAGFEELVRVVKASVVTMFFHTVFITILYARMPLSYYIIGAGLQFMLVLGIRFSYRFYLRLVSVQHHNSNNASEKNIMLVGAGSSGQMILRDIAKAKEVQDRVVCIIDDNPNKWHRMMEGVPVVGGRDEILSSVEKYKVDKIYLAIPSATAEQKRDILNICSQTECELKQLPGIYQFLVGEIAVSKMKDVSVEDLLGREPIRADMHEVFEFIKCSGDKAALTALLDDNAEFRQLDRASAEVINEVTGLNLDFTMEGEKVDVCKAIEQIRKEAIEEGDKHGEEKGILNSIRNLMETTSWTAQAAMDALKIPEADRAGYLAKL